MAVLKALVVDDAAFVRDLIRRTLRNQFPAIEVQEAADGLKAKAMLARSKFDLVLCDWEMPEMSGLELLRWVRQQDAYKKTPFVMVTSRGDRENVIEAIKEGVSDYLGKPFSPESLGKKIIKVMGAKLGGGKVVGAGSTAGPFNESANLLTGTPAAKAKPQPAEKNTQNAPPEAENLRRNQPGEAENARNLTSLRFAGHNVKAVLKGVTLTEARLVAHRSETLPGILAPAVVDIALSETAVARLNGYVHQLQAVELSQETEFVILTIRFVDDDPKKLEDLSHFIARFHG